MQSKTAPATIVAKKKRQKKKKLALTNHQLAVLDKLSHQTFVPGFRKPWHQRTDDIRGHTCPSFSTTRLQFLTELHQTTVSADNFSYKRLHPASTVVRRWSPQSAPTATTVSCRHPLSSFPSCPFRRMSISADPGSACRVEQLPLRRPGRRSRRWTVLD